MPACVYCSRNVVIRGTTPHSIAVAAGGKKRQQKQWKQFTARLLLGPYMIQNTPPKQAPKNRARNVGCCLHVGSKLKSIGLLISATSPAGTSTSCSFGSGVAQSTVAVNALGKAALSTSSTWSTPPFWVLLNVSSRSKIFSLPMILARPVHAGRVARQTNSSRLPCRIRQPFELSVNVILSLQLLRGQHKTEQR